MNFSQNQLHHPNNQHKINLNSHNINPINHKQYLGISKVDNNTNLSIKTTTFLKEYSQHQAVSTRSHWSLCMIPTTSLLLISLST